MPGFLKEFFETKLSEQKEELREFLRELVDEDKLEQAISVHNKYILAIPDSLSFFANIVLAPETRQEIRSYFSLVVAYIIEPGNYLRKSVPRTAMMTDNAYVLHSSLEIAIRTLDSDQRDELSEKIKEFEPIFEINPIVRKFIPEHISDRQDVIINYLEKLMKVKAAVKERPVYVFPAQQSDETKQ